MRKTRLQYFFTWVALGVLLICGLLLMAVSWNSILTATASPARMVLLWALISASGIYLFMLAVKKAHRQLVDKERSLREVEANRKSRRSEKKDASRISQELDFGSTARKLVRRVPENASLEEAGKEILKNLARELEIMSGIFYIRKKKGFEPGPSYALPALTEPYSFKEGEGLTGQSAKNQHLMVLTHLPEETIEVYSGLGKSVPTYLAIVPLIHKNKTVAVLECSGYRYNPHDIENMFRIFSRDLMEKLSPHLS